MCGIPSAIIFHKICKAIMDGERYGIEKRDGKTWTNQSTRSLAYESAYMSHATIKRSVDQLIKAGLLERGNYQDAPLDHSSWYAVTDKGRDFLPETPMAQNEPTLAQNEQIVCKMSQPMAQNEPTGKTLTPQGFEGNPVAEKQAENGTQEEPYIYNIFNTDIYTEKDKENTDNTDKYTDKNTDKSTVKTKPDKYADKRREILDYLNRKAGTKYRDGAMAKKFINARLNEGYTLEDFQTVIDSKCAEWLRTDMAKYLRPETLFGTKMDGYLGQAGMKSRTVGPNGIAMDPELLEDEELKIIFGG